MPASASNPTPDPALVPVAALGTWALPGLGHWLIEERWRAGIAGGAILAMWCFGLLLGGITVIDHRDDHEWFVRAGQYLVGPTLPADLTHQLLKWRAGSEGMVPGAAPASPALGRVREQAVLYTGLAGYLNLLLVLDLITRRQSSPRKSQGAPS